MGRLDFPNDYPWKPPSIKLITDSGRFETNSRICLSISDYHPESWNPIWPVRSIIIGLVSFFTTNDHTVGAINRSDDVRAQIAKESRQKIMNHEIYKRIFKAYENNIEGLGTIVKPGENEIKKGTQPKEVPKPPEEEKEGTVKEIDDKIKAVKEELKQQEEERQLQKKLAPDAGPVGGQVGGPVGGVDAEGNRLSVRKQKELEAVIGKQQDGNVSCAKCAIF